MTQCLLPFNFSWLLALSSLSSLLIGRNETSLREEMVGHKESSNMDERKDSLPVESRAERVSTNSSEVDCLNDAKLYRKIDRWILPSLFMCYTMTFMDKALINYANIMGLQKSLDLSGQQFSWLATALYIGYAVAEFPQGYLLQVFPPAKVLGLNAICWGIILCCTPAVHNFRDIVIVRTLLGCFEAIIVPALIMITSQWYTKRRATLRTGIWFCGIGAGQILGGLVSYAAQHGSASGSFPGWKIMFVSIGVLNLAVACLTLLWLPDTVDSARFLTEAEKDVIRTSLVLDQAGNGKKVFKLPSVWEAVGDVQVWLLFVISILIVVPSGAISTFSATMISGFGYNPKQTALLNIPSGVVSITATLIGSSFILKDFPRWIGICVLVIPAMLGAGLMSFYKGSQGGGLAGIYLINFNVAPMALVFSWVGSNIQGYTKKITASVIVVIGTSIGSIIGPQTFREQEAPQYLSAKIVLFALDGGIIVLSMLLRPLYGHRNRGTEESRRREIEALESGNVAPKDLEMEDQTDRTNPAFQYVY